MSAGEWMTKKVPRWFSTVRLVMAVVFCWALCVEVAIRISLMLIPHPLDAAASILLSGVLSLFILWALELCFLEWAKHVMDMFIISDWKDRSKNRVTFVKVYDSEFFVPKDQELVIRQTGDGKNVEIFAAESENSTSPPSSSS